MADFKNQKIQYGYLVTASSGGTLTLTNTSLEYQIITGTLAHTIVLPDSTGLTNGISFEIINVSTGAVTLNKNGGSLQATIAAGSSVRVILTDNGTAAGEWFSKTGTQGAAGGMASSIGASEQTSNYTILSTDDGKVIRVNTSAGAVTVTLPAPTAAFKVTIKDTGGFASVNNITIARNGSELIDGAAASVLITANQGVISLVSNGTNWYRADGFDRSSVQNSGRGIFAGGNSGAITNTIEYITIATTGNGTSFGNLTVARTDPRGCASSTRGLTAGGEDPALSNVIDYITIATTGNAIDFGDLLAGKSNPSACSNSTRGIFAGGNSGSVSNVIEYVNIAVLANAVDFGDLTVARDAPGACASSTRALFGGGNSAGNLNTIDYITIATTGNATSFGTLTVARNYPASCSNAIRGLFAGGDSGANSNVIDYVTIATTGNAVNFGNLTAGKFYVAGCSSSSRGVFGGGTTGSNTNAIDYVLIATTANATSFGTLVAAKRAAAGFSSSHGGLYG